MRALWLVRANLMQHPGGDTTQILQTAAALRARGVRVDLCSDPRPELVGCDVVHLFHLDRLWETQPWCRRIRAAGRAAVLSTIWWPTDEFDRGGRAGWQGRLARMVGSRRYETLRLAQRWLMQAAARPAAAPWRVSVWSFRRAVRYVLETARVLLPNSRAEQAEIERCFGVVRPAVVVPNAADAELFGPAADEGGGGADRAGVLCVGRLEPRKNQLALLAALRGTGIALTLVGQAGRFNAGYAQRCLSAADSAVRFIPYQPPEELRALYRAARVHACVSWYETPGLACLEAGLCGCALVVTPGGCTREYFGDQAHYCRPGDVSSIRAAVEAALAAGPPAGLAERIAGSFTWDAAAEQTLAAYRLALEKGGPRDPSRDADPSRDREGAVSI